VLRHSAIPEIGKIVPVGKLLRSPEVERMAAEGQKLREIGKRWIDVCESLGIVLANGGPDPGLAKKIVDQGYEPKLPATRQRLGLPPICITCGQKVKRVRHIPAWLVEAMDNLVALETAAIPSPEPVRVYARGGKRVRVNKLSLN